MNPGHIKTFTSTARLPFIDALKAIASQLIVLHHLAFYGPMSDYTRGISPGLFSWLSQHARIAVQVFLVIGGFLAAKALAKDGRLIDKPVAQMLWKRYLKLVLPYLFALLLAMAAATFSRSLMVHDSIPGAPGMMQFLAHVFLLQSVLDFDGLSAGAWYVAIDFQLYALLIMLLWLARHGLPNIRSAGKWCVLFLIMASLYYFNRDPEWDSWAVYFFGAYGLGAATYWATRHGHTRGWFVAIAAIAAGALWLDYRSRILVALFVACLIGLARCSGTLERWPKSRVIGWLGQISYSVFLIHFPVCLVINALFERFAPHTPLVQLGGILLAWAASLASGALFHYQVEKRAQAWLSGRRSQTVSPLQPDSAANH